MGRRLFVNFTDKSPLAFFFPFVPQTQRAQNGTMAGPSHQADVQPPKPCLTAKNLEHFLPPAPPKKSFDGERRDATEAGGKQRSRPALPRCAN